MGILFGKASFSFVRGTDWNDDVLLTDEETGDPIDLSGIAGLVMRVREDIGAVSLLECSTDNSRLVVLDATAGRIGIRVDSLTTRTAFPENDHVKAKYVYDVVIERAADHYEPATGGKITVLPQVTRPWDA